MTTIDLSVMSENDLRKSLSISFLRPAVEAEITRRQAEALSALDTIKAEGFTFSDGTHLSFIELVDFIQRTLAVKDTDIASVWSVVSEARSALGGAYPKNHAWKTLESYKTA